MSNNSRTLRDRIHDFLFRAFCSRHLLYNTCWEDPAVDRKALELTPRDSVLAITSAGCNVLDYALEGPQTIWAVDCNPAQTALLELKMAGIRSLDHEDFFRVFGLGRRSDFSSLYRRSLRPLLSPPSRDIWDRRTSWFEGRGWRNSFYWHGGTGLFARLLRDYFRFRPGLGGALLDLFDAPDLGTQRRIFDTRVEPLLWGRAVEWFLRRSFTMCLLGIPSAQREELYRHQRDLPSFIRSVLRRVFREMPAGTNYFWAVYVRGHYTESCCPEYLKRASFERLRRGLVDRIHPRTCTVTDFLKSSPHRFSRFILLDHMDWMSRHKPQDLTEEWELILDRAAPGARVLFRSAARYPLFLERLYVRTKGRPPNFLANYLAFDRARAEELSSLDRVGTYSSFHIAEIRPLRSGIEGRPAEPVLESVS
jgi:S-adenosylmethionine-diacylglycerol 3-amino-3-carboxypropyl transferase